MTFRLAGALGALLVVGSFGCERRDEPTREVTTPANPAVESPATPDKVTTPVIQEREPAVPPAQVKGKSGKAMDEIASARCAREQRCNNIGADRKFASQDSCMQEIKKEWAEELNAYECPAGIDQKELNECLEEVRNEDCNNPFDKLGRAMACRSSDICQAVTPE